MITKIQTACSKTILINRNLNSDYRYEWIIRDDTGILKRGASTTVMLAKIASLNATFFIAKKEKCHQIGGIKHALSQILNKAMG